MTSPARDSVPHVTTLPWRRAAEKKSMWSLEKHLTKWDQGTTLWLRPIAFLNLRNVNSFLSDNQYIELKLWTIKTCSEQFDYIDLIVTSSSDVINVVIWSNVWFQILIERLSARKHLPSGKFLDKCEKLCVFSSLYLLTLPTKNVFLVFVTNMSLLVWVSRSGLSCRLVWC